MIDVLANISYNLPTTSKLSYLGIILRTAIGKSKAFFLLILIELLYIQRTKVT